MVVHQYPSFSISLYPFICQWQSNAVVATEHAQAIWVDPADLIDYDWAEADLPVVEEYLHILSNR
jgi:8-oxo-dGTP diphosphatase